MNKVIEIGRLTNDPEIRYTQGENPIAIARYTLAVQRNFKNAEGKYDADFINCIAYKNNAVFAEKYFKKGQKVAIEGRIQTGSYTNREGQKVYTTDIVVESQEFAQSKAENTPIDNNNRGYGDVSVQESFMNVPEGIDEELPFN